MTPASEVVFAAGQDSIQAFAKESTPSSASTNVRSSGKAGSTATGCSTVTWPIGIMIVPSLGSALAPAPLAAEGRYPDCGSAEHHPYRGEAAQMSAHSLSVSACSDNGRRIFLPGRSFLRSRTRLCISCKELLDPGPWRLLNVG